MNEVIAFPTMLEYLMAIAVTFVIAFYIGRKWQESVDKERDYSEEQYEEALDQGYKQGHEDGMLEQYNLTLPKEQSWKKYV